MALEDVVESVQGSLDRLGFIPDLYLIHYPQVVNQGELKALWNIFEQLKDQGKLKSIGVSNFRPQDLEAVLDGAKYKPVVNQVTPPSPINLVFSFSFPLLFIEPLLGLVL
jgi:diketogulonate reductase-like aldo/keto reductase